MLALKRLYAQIVFRIGDIHRTNRFPWVSWALKKHKVEYDEILNVLPNIKYGDVGLHRDAGYLSNLFIPGFMKHAWLHVEDSEEGSQIIEAISDGVVQRSAVAPMYSDYTIILGPKGVTEEERKGACLKAKQVVGVGYDPFFEFDIEEQLQFYTGKDASTARQEPQHWQANAYSYTFSCTEVVSYAWWHKREELKLFRTRRFGKETILADDFFNDAWQIKWMSASVTVASARALGLHAKGLEMIESYLAERGD